MLQLQFLNLAKPPMWLVESNYRLGASAECNCVLELPGVMPLHATLLVDNDQAQLTPMAAHTAVNGHLITAPTLVGHGDTLELGGALITLVDPKIARKLPEVPVSALSDATALVPRVPDTASPWHLQPMSTALEPKVHNLVGKMVLGRAKECDIRLNFAHLSRRHATLTVLPQGLELEDLGSSNGTFVNDVKVRRVLLKNGDILSFDTLRFRIIGPEDDLEKTSVRPALAEELNPTHLLVRPNPDPASPLQKARLANPSVRPSNAQAAAASQRARMALLVGIALVVFLFSFLIVFLLN
jgi:hypothetical protein